MSFFSDPMPNVMIDLETMGTRHNAPIIALGAVAFNLATLEIGEKFYVNINLASSVALGSVMDPETVMWWMQQSEDARKAVTRKGRQAPEVLVDFSDWLTSNAVALKDRRIWACGTDFDCVILAEHYRKAEIDVPWMYYATRDYRTIRELWKSVPEGTRVGAHNALDDAVHQVSHLFKIRKTLKGAA
jgi:exodeoxyribonuclease VIII